MKGMMNMKKNELITGILYLLAGGLFLLVNLLTDTPLDSLLIGFAGGAVGGGLAMVYRYFYWSAPKNQKRYEEKLAREQIELHDELKVQLRDRSGRYAYLLGLAVCSSSIVVFSVLGSLKLVESRVIILYLGGYLVFQLVAGAVIFRLLMRRY